MFLKRLFIATGLVGTLLVSTLLVMKALNKFDKVEQTITIADRSNLTLPGVGGEPPARPLPAADESAVYVAYTLAAICLIFLLVAHFSPVKFGVRRSILWGSFVVSLIWLISLRTVRPVGPEVSFPNTHDFFPVSLRIPTEVYEGTSLTVEITVFLERLHIPLSLRITPPKLEVELLAAGVEIGGDARQSSSILVDRPKFVWNCHFSKSENYELTTNYRLISADGVATLLATRSYPVKVSRIDHLTQRQVWLLALILGAPTATLGLVKLLQETGLLRKSKES